MERRRGSTEPLSDNHPNYLDWFTVKREDGDSITFERNGWSLVWWKVGGYGRLYSPIGPDFRMVLDSQPGSAFRTGDLQSFAAAALKLIDSASEAL